MTLPADPLAAIERACVAEEVASIARHDLRNRLASIRNAAFYIKRRVEKSDLWESDARVPQFFGLIEQAVIGADAVVEDRLHPARLYERRIAPVSFRACVERALACARVPATARFELDVEDVQVSADAEELAVALRCLIENAVEAVPDGAVRITGQASEAPVSAREGAQAISMYEVRVVDQGPGVPPEALEQATRAGFSQKPGHIGLGLAIAARVARRYRGDLVFDSPDRGASVGLVLPRLLPT